MNNPVEKQDHYNAINGLRALSAIGIILMHVLANGNYNLNGFVFEKVIPSFTNLVFLFMMISGFAMCCGYYEKIVHRKISVEQFYNRRHSKIWPFFAVLCILEFIVSPSKNALYEVFANLTLCFGFLNTSISVIGVGWFLGIVFIFYIAFPFFCYLILNKKRAWFSFLISLAFNVLCEKHFGLGRTNIVYSFVFFSGGGLIYLYRSELTCFSNKYRWYVFLACIIAASIYYMFSPTILITLALGTLMIIYALGHSRKVLNNKYTEFLSSISMEAYLSHMVIYRVVERLSLLHVSNNNI